MRFEGQTALVTGASSGLGRATARAFAEAGAAVVLNGVVCGRGRNPTLSRTSCVLHKLQAISPWPSCRAIEDAP
ncbi:SDR family NAD(P)-dependent oxidoreductase [Sphingomonas sp. UMB7805-LC452B]